MNQKIECRSETGDIARPGISRRGFLAGLCASTGWLLLAACETGSIPKDSTDGANHSSFEAVLTPPATLAETTEPPVEATANPETTARVLPYAGVDIEFRFNGLDPNSVEAVRREVKALEELSGIKVRVDLSGWAPCLQIPCPTPDIWYGRSWGTPGWVDKGYALALDDYVATWDEWEDYYPSVREDVMFEGHAYGIPFRTTYRGSVVIRPSLFEAAGLAPEPPATWDQLNELAPKLTVRDGETFEQAGVNLQHHTQVYEDFLVQAGGQTFSPDLARPLNSTPEGHLALAQHVRHGLVDESMPREGLDSGIPNLHAFCAGKVAIQMLWPGNVGNCETNAPEVYSDLAVGPPLEGPRRRGLQLYVDKYMVWEKTKNPDVAFEVLKFFSAPQRNYEINVFGDRSMPCRGAMEEFELYRSEPWKSFLENLQFGRIRQVVPWHFAVQDAMSRWVEEAALEGVTVPEALRGMDEEVHDIVSGV